MTETLALNRTRTPAQPADAAGVRVGFDFGATSLKVEVYCPSSESYTTVTYWRHERAHDERGHKIIPEAKTLSLHFKRPPDTASDADAYYFGFSAQGPGLRGLKLSLDDDEIEHFGQQQVARRFREECESHGLHPHALFKELLLATAQTIRKFLAEQEWEWASTGLTVSSIFTRPDAASRKIQALYRSAAEQAGMPNVQIESEGECDAQWLLRTRPFQPPGVKSRSLLLLLVNTGGMTTDFTALELDFAESTDYPSFAVLRDDAVQGGMELVWNRLEAITRQRIPKGAPEFAYDVWVRAEIYKLTSIKAIKDQKGEVLITNEELEIAFAETFKDALEMLASFCKLCPSRVFLLGDVMLFNKYVQMLFKGKLGGIACEVLRGEDAFHSVAKGAATPWPPLNVKAVFENHYVGIALQNHRGKEYLLVFKRPSGAKPEDFEAEFHDVSVQGQDLNTLKIFPGHARATTPLISDRSPDSIAFGQYQVTDCIDIPLPPLQQSSGRGRHRLRRRTVGVRLGPPMRSHKDGAASHYVSIQVREGGNSVYAEDFRVDRSRFSLAFIDCDEADDAGKRRRSEEASIAMSNVGTPNEPAPAGKGPRSDESGSCPLVLQDFDDPISPTPSEDSRVTQSPGHWGFSPA